MKPKTKLTGPDSPEFVARGEAELCINQAMEILRTMGVELVGPLPPELQNVKVERYTARLPLGLAGRLLKGVGVSQEHKERAADDYLRRLEERKDARNRVFMQLLKEVGSERR